MSKKKLPNQPGADRFAIATKVLTWSTTGLFLISAIALIGGAFNGKVEFLKTSDRVFTSVLPLLGTWVGTVMAFYFSRDSFDSASQSVRETYKDMFQERLKSKKVDEVMVPFGKIVSVNIDSDNEAGLKKIKIEEAFIKKLVPGKVTRIPVFTKSNIGKYIIHESYLYKFISEISPKTETSDIKPSDATLHDMFSHDGGKYKELMSSSVAFVSIMDSLAQAKEQMESQSKGNVRCQDAFVTQDGSSTSPVLGWLTNSDVLAVLQT